MVKTPLEQAIQYLIDKTHAVNVNNPRAHAAAVKLRACEDYKVLMPKLVGIAFNIMQYQFTKNTPQIPAGYAKLTNVSEAIGQQVLTTCFGHATDPRLNTKVGDFFAEAFIQSQLIVVYRHQGFNENAARAPYVVEPKPLWEFVCESMEDSIIRFSVHDKPEPVSTFLQPHGYPLIKGNAWQDPAMVKMFEETLIDAPFVKSIDRLQSTPWVINTEVLAIVEDHIDEIMEPQIPDPANPVEKIVLKKAYKAMDEYPTANNIRKYNEAAALWEATVRPRRIRSKRAETRTILAKANILKEWECFYQLVDNDYRGRSYYKEPFLNYQGSDLARALMKFKKAKPLGETGKQSLAVHTANSFNQKYTMEELQDIDWLEEDYISILEADQVDTISVDKFSLADRVEWFNQNQDMVFDTAEQGIIHKKDAEKPIVFLACCLEWLSIEAQELEGKEPLSSLPVPVDGTCNGYQHSAAISKDEVTGPLVALEDSAVPSDLYIKVAQKLVEMEPEWFAERNMSYADIRKLIAKRGTMTRAYSAGAETIAESMYSDCVQAGADQKHNITSMDCDKLAKSLLKAIKEVCPGSQKSMKFFQELAAWVIHPKTIYKGNKVISRKTRGKLRYDAKVINDEINKTEEPTQEQFEALMKANAIVASLTERQDTGLGHDDVRWVTASGFPVVYQSFMTETVTCKSPIIGVIKSLDEDQEASENQKLATSGQSTTRVEHALQIYLDIPDRQSFAAGIAPNVVHSQDATHMSLVINELGEDFGCVHDSYSCHASDVERMKEITQQVFFEMYDQDNPFEGIKSQFLGEDAHKCDVKTPPVGTLDISKVLTSRNFFS